MSWCGQRCRGVVNDVVAWLTMSSPRKRGPRSILVNLAANLGVVRDMKQPVVYILASKPNGTLYVGVTTDLARRVDAHRSGVVGGFTKKYGIERLVYFELHDDILEAIQREKRLKKWNRAWKIELIEKTNPDWSDLSDQAG
jgi:putative endonuclease